MNEQLHRIGLNLFSGEGVTIQITSNSKADFSRVCRTCLLETEDNKLENEALFLIGCNGNVSSLYEMYEAATGLTIAPDDMLPPHICNSCLQNIKNCFNFRCRSQRANHILQSILMSLNSDAPIYSKIRGNQSSILKIPKTENEEQLPDEIREETPKTKLELQQEENEDEFTEEIPEADEQDQNQQPEFLNFDEYSVDDSVLSLNEGVLQDDGNGVVTMEIEKMGDISEGELKTKESGVVRCGFRVIQCDFCKSIFSLQRDLIRHYRTEHPDEKPFKCDVCSVSFVHIQSMRRHKNTHAPCPKQKACPHCNWSFTRSDDLTRHLRTHTDERPYACSICQKAFKQYTELKDHMLSHEDKKMYKCEPCNKEWRSRNGWYLHMKSHRDGRIGRRKQRSKKLESNKEA